MTRDEIFSKVRTTLVDDFEISPEQVTLEATLQDDLELDSIDAIDMAVRLQKMTGIRLEEDDLKKLKTVGDTVALVERLVATKG